jgi:hypothetical protein
MAQALDCLGPTPTNFIPYFSVRLMNGIRKGMSICLKTPTTIQLCNLVVVDCVFIPTFFHYALFLTTPFLESES